jgi:hypothetical protein
LMRMSPSFNGSVSTPASAPRGRALIIDAAHAGGVPAAH